MKARKLGTFVGLLLSILSLSTQGQHKNIFTEFQSDFKKANKQFNSLNYSVALSYYQKALVKDSTNDRVKLGIANCYRLLNDNKQAEVWYRKIQHVESFSPKDQLNYGQALLANGKYEESKKWFKLYKSNNSSDSLARRKIEGIANLHTYFEDSLNHPIQNVPFTTDHAEFSPVYYKDGLVFVSSRSENTFVKIKDSRTNISFYELYYSPIDNNGNTSGSTVKFEEFIEGKLHKGPVCFYNNDQGVIYTKNNSTKISSNKLNRLSLYYATKNTSGKWSDVHAMPFNGSNYSVSHPSVSPDGKKLFFASDMPGGFGGTDIYLSELNDDAWGEPVNLGPMINTSGNEVFPFIYKDSTLYFSSDGYGGIGGLDVYESNIVEGKFTTVKNIGYPINSMYDDFGIIFDKNGKNGFFCSNRKNGGLDDDIYSFKVVKVPAKGLVLAKLKNNPLEGVLIKLYKKGKEFAATTTREDGSFLLQLDPGKEYQLMAFKEDYKTIRTTISTADYESGKPVEINLVMEKSHKVFVKGVVKIDTMTVQPYAKVYYQEKGSGVIDTVSANEDGEFNCEIESDFDHLFFTQVDGLFDTVTVKSTKRKKGSVLFYLNMHLQKYYQDDVKGLVKDTAGVKPGIEVLFRNNFTGKTDTVTTDDKGNFTFKAASFGQYDITASDVNSAVYYHDFNIVKFKEPLLELYLKPQTE